MGDLTFQDKITWWRKYTKRGVCHKFYKFLTPYEKMTSSMNILAVEVRVPVCIWKSCPLKRLIPVLFMWSGSWTQTWEVYISSICRVITFVSMGHLVWSTSYPLPFKPPPQTDTSSLLLSGSWLSRVILLLIGVCY